MVNEKNIVIGVQQSITKDYFGNGRIRGENDYENGVPQGVWYEYRATSREELLVNNLKAGR